ncbi:uncharacterized protein [Arachis hypogaea]|uniref:uncharacterized protein n=1 Tax=Arachis hypogaea TaxID=3818 RepID=UPI003B219CC2
MFNEALYGKRRRQDNTLIDNWIDEYLLEDSEEEDTDRSSIPITRRWINRDREAGHDRLFQDYFADDPVYHADIFRRRFRMRRHVFLRIVDALSNVYPYFQQRVDATGRRGLSPLQKCTAAIRMLAYGVAADVVDDYVRIGESTTIECLEKFVEGVISVFEDEYLRKPNPNDVQRLLQMAEGRGFPGMLGSIDCMHWQWKNCPKAWKGMYMSGYRGVATIVLEVVASSDLWIWHAFFGVSGSNNNINVLDRSPVFDDILNDRAPEVNYTINGNNYTMGYYLADGIYPEWATFVKSISKPQGKKRKLFAQYQEGQRKDVERAFGVLQARFAIIRGPARFWEKKKLANIMRACIILHNMIVEDERDTYAGNFAQGLEYDDVENGLSQPQLGEEDFAPYHQFLQRNAQLRNRQQHRQLKEDLIEHICECEWDEIMIDVVRMVVFGPAYKFGKLRMNDSLSCRGDIFSDKVSYKKLFEENKLIFRRFQGNTLKNLTDDMMSIGVENEQDRLIKYREERKKKNPGLPWISNWNKELLVARMRAEIDGHMNGIQKNEADFRGFQFRKQKCEESLPIKKQKSKKKIQTPAKKTKIGTEIIEEFSRQSKKKKTNEEAAAHGIPEVNLANETDPLFQGQMDQSSVESGRRIVRYMSIRSDPAPEATAAVLLMMAQTASYVPREFPFHHSALASLIQAKKKHKPKRGRGNQNLRWEKVQKPEY